MHPPLKHQLLGRNCYSRLQRFPRHIPNNSTREIGGTIGLLNHTLGAEPGTHQIR